MEQQYSREDMERARRTSPFRLLPETYPVRRSGDSAWKLKCPLHDDTRPSLGVKRLDSGVWIWRCFGCGEAGDSIGFAMQVCGMSFRDAVAALVDGTAVERPRRVVATYDYVGADGAHLYQVVRYLPKAFRQRHKTDAGWKWGLPPGERVLYRLGEAIAAAKAGRVVVYVEGEKDADAVSSVVTATTNSGGCEAFRATMLDAIVGCELVIAPDRDEPGMALAWRVFAAASERGMSPRLALVPEPYKDVSEYMASGGDIMALIGGSK